MPAFSGSFSGGLRLQSVSALSDEPNHSLSLAEITGAQKCSDARWNDATITSWGTTDLVGNSGTQRGYFVNDHGAKAAIPAHSKAGCLFSVASSPSKARGPLSSAPGNSRASRPKAPSTRR
jgi:hypothetical protein